MPLDRETAVNETLAAWRRVFREVQRGAAPDWLHLELTMAQLKALFAIAHNGSPTVSVLAESLEVGLSAASQIVERLVQQGLVDRHDDPSDRRRAFVRLTPRGQQLVTRLREGSRDRLQNWISRLGDDDLTALAQGLHALADLASHERDGGAPPIR